MMDETILPPSPNWFQVSGVAVTNDGWIAYGGPSKSLCILEPLPANHNGVLEGPRYHAHVFNRANSEKIVSVAISPEWPAKRLLLTGSSDGSVKQWNVEKLIETNKVKAMLSHEIHSLEREEIAGVDYSNETYAVTVGCFGNIVKWDLNTNIVKLYTLIKNFKPLCMSCSPHIPLNVAIGTKQGVVFVLDLNGLGKIIYKVRGQDDEIVNISWCPQFEVTVKKSLKESDKRVFKQETDNKKETESDSTAAPKHVKEELDGSGLGKNLPDDSFDGAAEETVIVPEDEMFDIYKDHAADEFGHKKFQSEEICVKIQEETKVDDFLAECLKLKADILKNKEDSSMQALVDALDSTHVDSKQIESASCSSKLEDGDKTNKIEASMHIHKHFLASIGKYGGVRIWSKSGKLVGSCVVAYNCNKNQKGKMQNWPTILWYKPDLLLLADGKSQLVEVNPLKIDCKNKLDWSIVHGLHKRGLYCIASNAPRVQSGKESSDDWNVYTASQDRNIIQYSLKERKTISVQATCGGFIYTVLPCPYDAGKIAISVGDGAVRIWETSTVGDDDTKLSRGHVTSYWQNVQGKVLTVAWHPTKENLVAFATAESRIGLLDISTKNEKPAKVFIPAMNGPIYCISWGEGNKLYACANGDLVVYQGNKIDEAPMPLRIEVDGQKWEVSSVRWCARGLVCSSAGGAVAVLTPDEPHTVLAATLVFSKTVYMVEWHPQQTSNSSDESPYKNLLATCSYEKNGNIVILEYGDKEDGGKQLQTYKTLTGHRLAVLQLQWNPHVDGQLLSTCQDYTVRIWDVSLGACMSVFAGHAASSLGAAWAAHPQLATKVLSGGGDCALRLWDIRDYPLEAFDGAKVPLQTRKERKSKKKEKEERLIKEQENEQRILDSNPGDQRAVRSSGSVKGPKKFLLPIVTRPNSRECLLHAARIVFKKYLEKSALDTDVKGKMEQEIDSKQKLFTERKQDAADSSADEDPAGDEVDPYNFEFLKIFGSINEVNELLDKQLEHHEELKNCESWITLCAFRGHIDAMIQYAAQRDLLCPYLLSIAPCVSYKYWKDVMQLYLAQIDRQVAKGEEKKIEESGSYGGAIYRKVLSLLSLHDVRGAVAALSQAKLYKEAYILCRTRYMDSIAEETLKEWADERMRSGLFLDAAIFNIIMGNLTEAATNLGKIQDQECLNLAADIAKVAGQNMLVDHLSEKRENIKNNSENTDKTDEILEQLPSRIELLMKENAKAAANLSDTPDKLENIPNKSEESVLLQKHKNIQKNSINVSDIEISERKLNGESNGHVEKVNGVTKE